MGGQGGCERRIEVFVKIKKTNFFFWGGGGGRGELIEELKFLGKFTKKKIWGWGGGGGGWGGFIRDSGWGGQGGCE